MSVTISQNNQIPPGPSVAEIAEVSDIYSLDLLSDYQQRFGNFFTIPPKNEKGQPIFVLNDPQLIKHVLSTNHKNYRKGMGFDRVEVLLGNGLIVSDGPIWHQHRKMIQPSFHPTKLAKFEQMMQWCNKNLLRKWQQAFDNDQLIDVTTDMSEMTLNIVLSAIFSDDIERMTELYGANPFEFITDESTRDLAFARKFRDLTKLIATIIEERKMSGRRPFDFLSQFIDARDRKTNQAMNIKEVVNEVTTLIIAGHETTASSLNWAWYLLSQNPTVEAQFHQEIDTVLKGRIATFADLPKLQYTKQIIQEAIRLYPPVWLLTRRAIADDEIGGCFLPAGSNIFISPYMVHRLQEYWDNPENFHPDRFQEQAVQQRDRFSYLPFSAGPRKCIGDYISICEAQMHLSFIGQLFQLRYNIDQPVEIEAKVNLRTKHPLRMKLEKRMRVQHDIK